MRIPLLAVAAALVVLTGPSSVRGQEDGPLRFRLSSEGGGLELEIGNLFDSELGSALDEGFPIRIQLEVTLWRTGFFDRRVGEYDWRASARKEATESAYRLAVADDESRSVPDFDSLRAALSRRITVPLRPGEPGRHYYQIILEVASLSTSDLDELERWLAGEADAEEPQEDRGALGRGVQRLFVRALGLPSRRLQRRTRVFDWPG